MEDKGLTKRGGGGEQRGAQWKPKVLDEGHIEYRGIIEMEAYQSITVTNGEEGGVVAYVKLALIQCSKHFDAVACFSEWILG